MVRYYSLPIDFTSILDENPEPLKTCTEIESIDNYLELMITTCPGEHRSDPEWGCKIWEKDFELVTSHTKWEAWCINVLTEMVNRYEPRLKQVKVEVKILEIVKEQELFGNPAIRKRMDVYVNANLVSTGEPCRFYYKIYMGPISVE